MSDPNEIKRLVEFAELSYADEWLDSIRSSFDEERVTQAVQKRSIDKEIENLILAS